jgi:hypothetical protein
MIYRSESEGSVRIKVPRTDLPNPAKLIARVSKRVQQGSVYTVDPGERERGREGERERGREGERERGREGGRGPKYLKGSLSCGAPAGPGG